MENNESEILANEFRRYQAIRQKNNSKNSINLNKFGVGMGKGMSGVVRKTLYVVLLVSFLMSATVGTVSAAEVIVYGLSNFGGESLDATSDQPGVTLTDKVSSIKVLSGTWRFHEYPHYGGRFWDLGPGEYPSVQSVGIPDDLISSFKQI